MAIIEFKNKPNTDTPINDTNLNHNFKELNENIIQNVNNFNNSVKGTILFENADGDNSTSLTLNDSVVNYKDIEVIYGYQGFMKSAKAPATKAIPLFLSRSGYYDNSYYAVRQISTEIRFNGAIATKPIGYTFTFKTNNTMVFNDTLNDIYIYKIIGYK